MELVSQKWLSSIGEECPESGGVITPESVHETNVAMAFKKWFSGEHGRGAGSVVGLILNNSVVL